MNQPDYLDMPSEFPPAWASAYGQDSKGYWLELVFYNQSLHFRWIPGGQFTMGSNVNETGRDDDEDPHKVVLTTGFWLAEITVTQALWLAVMGENPSYFQKGETGAFPVEQVSWEDVQSFIAQLNQFNPDIKVRLPWEAEWEYACRAGSITPFSFGNNISPEQVNYDGDNPYADAKKGLNRKKTVAVKSLAANSWGLYEMHGNVWEWCQDSWQENLGTEQVSDPWLLNKDKLEQGAGRVLRGGSWSHDGRLVRSAMRSCIRPVKRYNDIGFRLSLGL